MTKDSLIVLMHDKTINHSVSVSGKVQDYYNQWKIIINPTYYPPKFESDS